MKINEKEQKNKNFSFLLVLFFLLKFILRFDLSAFENSRTPSISTAFAGVLFESPNSSLTVLLRLSPSLVEIETLCIIIFFRESS